MFFPSVIKINQAHVIMLMEREIISKSDAKNLLKALMGVKKILIKPRMEDIHMYIEEEVTKIAGIQVGGNLHIAKSRNDQVSSAIRMKLRQDLFKLSDIIITLQETLIHKAQQNINTIFPGYTHLQPAQPITLAHYLLSCIDVLERDLQRIRDLYPKVNRSPMGACALATTSFAISRKRVAELLGFDSMIENSLDAVKSRDFLLETLAVLTILAINISRMIEDLIIWSSQEFGLIELPDDFASTSSIMPQKKNPDVLEVIRARTSHIVGNLVSTICCLKALPSSYNLDLQEITPKLWDSIRIIDASLKIFSKLYLHLKVNEINFDKPIFTFMTATELTNMLNRKYGITFRRAHKTVGELTNYLIKRNKTMQDISSKLLETFLKKNIDLTIKISLKDIKNAIDPKKFVEAHNILGGPSSNEVKRMLKTRKILIFSSKEWINTKRKRLFQAEKKLKKAINIFF